MNPTPTDPKSRLLDKFYQHKEKINILYFSIINYLLGQEWVWPGYTGINVGDNGVFYAGLNNDYPAFPIIDVQTFADCTNQLDKIFGARLDLEEYRWLENRVNSLPFKFEIYPEFKK